jgi:hypothetical protein
MAFHGSAEALASVAPEVRVKSVAGADHFYTGVRPALVEAIEEWLRDLG